MHEDSPLIEAIALWEQITGVSPPDADGYWRSGAGGNTWAIRDTYKALKEALELDPSEVTATLLLGKFLEEYLKQATASMASLLDAPEEHLAQLANARKLRTIINAEDIVEARDTFIAGLKAALDRYGAGDRADVQQVLTDHATIAVLRRDALRSLTKLRVDQFLEGDSEAADYRPIYVNDVHLWWNINSLLKAMTSMPSGVSLNLVRDPNAYESYFAFAIRNGGNLFVLSDVPEHAHPLQASMARKPGRDLDRRIAKNWFPYDLLGMEMDEKGDSVQKRHSDETAIALYQPDTFPMMKIGAIPAHECIWVTMMLDLIVSKFWKGKFRAKQLSYTGEMIKVQDTLLIAAARTALVVADKPLELPALTLADVTGDSLDPKQIGKMYDQPNRWMEERYKHRIVDESLNLLAGPGEVRKLIAAEGATEIKKFGALEDDCTDEDGKHLWSTDLEKRNLRQTQLVTMSATKFGTPEELEADRRWYGRYNAAQQIQLHAKREYEERKAEIEAWFIKRVKANKAKLIRYALNDEIWINNGVFGGFSHADVGGVVRHVESTVKDDTDGASPGGKKSTIIHSFIRHYDLTIPSEKLYQDAWMRHSGLNLGGNFYDSKGRYQGSSCVITDAKASTSTIFFPSTSTEIAVLCGCEVKDLPDVLRNWRKVDPYRGNSILDRIDPMIWKVSNPWERIDFRVRIPFSILGRRRAQKDGPLLPLLLNIYPNEQVKQDRIEKEAQFALAFGKKVEPTKDEDAA